MKILFRFILIFSVGFFQLTAQNLSEKASVSVITCGPGSELYAAFGHSAFRVFDPELGIDKCYNYGTFDFNAPHFYANFAKGNLIYFLSVSNFGRFLQVYQYENRWVKNQLLNLNPAEVQAMFNYLENNATLENRAYRYDFFYDNCSTKIEEVVTAVLKNKVTFSNNHISTTKTHRDLIADYTQDFKWGKFGIDLALGSVIDDEATKNDYKFLPDYIFEAFNHATITRNNKTQPLVINTIPILAEKTVAKPTEVFSPLNVLAIISLLIIFITYKNYQNNTKGKWLDFIIYFSTGAIGIVVLLLWFATAHTATYKNLNFLWAFAPNIVVAFYLLKTNLPTWVKLYNWLLIVLLVILAVVWILKIQVFNVALIPLLIALVIRYLFLRSKS
jgi:hypothetical protein